MPRLISIDLGAHAVKVNTYRVAGRKYEFEQRHRVAVPQDGEVPTFEARLAALDAILEDHPHLAGAGSDTVALSIPGEHVTFHRITMPFTDRAQVEKTLPFAVEAEVPFDLDDMVLGWRMLRQRGQSEVLVALVRHALVAGWIGALATRKVDPAMVFVDSELLGHFGQGAPAPAEGSERPTAVAVIDIGHVHTLVSVVVDGTVHASRAINVGGFAFTRAIQQAMGCSWAEAEARKHGAPVGAGGPGDLPANDDVTDVDGGRTRKPSGYSRLPDQARAAMDGAIGLMLAELRSTLIDAEDACGVSVEEIRLTGGGSRIPELWGYLAADLGVPVKRASDPDGERMPVTFHLSHALAMHVSSQSSSRAIDLRIGDLEYRGGTDMLRAVMTYGSSGVAFFTLAAVLMFAVQYRSLSVEHSTADAALRDLVAESFPEIPTSTLSDGDTSLAMARALCEDAQQRARILSRGGAGVPPTIDLMATLTDAFPPHEEVEVEVEQLTITPAQITFDAETDGYASSARVEEDLQSHPRFKNATKGQETKLSNGRVKFPIHIPFGDQQEEG